jgi:hypothetical protein
MSSSHALHGTLGSYPRDTLQQGSAEGVACLPIPRAWACGGDSPCFFSFAWLFLLLIIVRNN